MIAKKNTVCVICTLLLAAFLFSVAIPVAFGTGYSFRLTDSPLLTDEMYQAIVEYDMLPYRWSDCLIGFGRDYPTWWTAGTTWEQMRERAIATPRNRLVAFKTAKGIQAQVFSNYTFNYLPKYNDRVPLEPFEVKNQDLLMARRLFAMKEGYHYNGVTYGVRNIYWFWGSKPQRGGYAAIETDGGVFFEWYNRPWEAERTIEGIEVEQIVLVLTQEEFEHWYPIYVQPEIEYRQWVAAQEETIYGGGYILNDFDKFLAENGVELHRAQPQGVGRITLTLFSFAFVIGYPIRYKVNKRRNRRKQGQVPEPEEP